MEDEKELAARMYDAYGNYVGWKNYAGLPMPTWEQLPATIRGAWRYVAEVRTHLKTRVVEEGSG